MRIIHVKAALLMLMVLFMIISPAMAQGPRESLPRSIDVAEATFPDIDDDYEQVGGPGPEPVENVSRASLAVGPELSWVPKTKSPGFYAVRDNRNLDPNEYNLVGGHQSFYWDRLNYADGQYDWSPIDAFINAQVAKGKKAAIGIITFNARSHLRPEIYPYDPPIRVPQWVFQKGARKVICGQLEIPRYWDSVYLAEYRKFVLALGARYDGHPHLEFVQIGVGKYGETQPCDDVDNACVRDALRADGLTEWSWAGIVNQITDMYADAFRQTVTLLPNSPRFYSEGDRGVWTRHAVSRGVGLFPAGLYAIAEWVDLRGHATLSGSGKYDLLLDQAEAGNVNPWVPVAFEMYAYMTPDPITFFWGVLAGLSRRADYITAERDVLYHGAANDPVVTPIVDNIATIGWANQYLGKHIDETPSVWVALREAGYRDTYRPQKGNYSWWLIQDDSIPNGRTVPTTYRSRQQLVYSWHYDASESAVNLNIETNQAFLGPSKEGWICRRTNEANGNRYMYFKIDDRYMHGGPAEATITVRYLDRGFDSWQLQYDAVGDANKVAGTINKQNSGAWKDAVFTVSDARFANSQAGGADFRIDSMGDGNEYIHMVDVRKGSGSAVQTQQINLVHNTTNHGWNLVSMRLQPTSTAVADVLSSIAGKYDAVQAYQNGSWVSLGSGLTNLDHTQGFWVRVTQNCTLTISGNPPTTTTLSLTTAHGGWNMVSWPSASTRPVNTALSAIAGQVTVVYAYDAQDVVDPWKVYDPMAPSYANTLSQFAPGRAYWIRVSGDANLVVDY